MAVGRKLSPFYFAIKTEVNKHFKSYTNFNDDMATRKNPFYYPGEIDLEDEIFYKDELYPWLDRELVLERYILNFSDNLLRDRDIEYMRNDIQDVLQYDELKQFKNEKYCFNINLKEIRD